MNKNLGPVQIVLGLLAAGGMFAYLIAQEAAKVRGDVPTTVRELKTPDKYDAYAICKQFVTDQLASPSTARFPFGGGNAAEDLGGGRFRARSHVDAQNALGATVRNAFDCTVEHAGTVGDEFRWRLQNLTIQ